MISYTKLRSGDWGLRSTTPLTVGTTVVVTTKAGAVKKETVRHLVWSGAPTGQSSKIYLYAISTTRSSSSRVPHGKIECDECGEYVTPGSRCWETGMQH